MSKKPLTAISDYENKLIGLSIKDVFKIVKMYENEELVGKRFGLLTVLSYIGRIGTNYYCMVECDCGTIKKVSKANLPYTKSCGCAAGKSIDPLYEIPEHLNDKKRKIMRNGELLVFENGDVFRIKGKLLYPCSVCSIGRGGKYECITFQKEGKQILEYIHRLVAEAFIPNPNNKPEVNHVDNDGHNNDVSNLEWVTGSENVTHAVEQGFNNRMKNAEFCLLCEEMETSSPFQICSKCKPKLNRFENRKRKIEELREKYKKIDYEKLTCREKQIVSSTVNGQTHEQIADTHGISRQRVSQILNDVLKTKSMKG